MCDLIGSILCSYSYRVLGRKTYWLSPWKVEESHLCRRSEIMLKGYAPVKNKMSANLSDAREKPITVGTVIGA